MFTSVFMEMNLSVCARFSAPNLQMKTERQETYFKKCSGCLHKKKSLVVDTICWDYFPV